MPRPRGSALGRARPVPLAYRLPTEPRVEEPREAPRDGVRFDGVALRAF